MQEDSYSFMAVEGAVVQLSTLKRPITGHGFIVRLFNPSSSPIEPVLTFGPEVLRIAETTLLEVVRSNLPVVDGQAVVRFGPFEVKTLWLDLDVTTGQANRITDAGPQILQLEPNFPNPFALRTTITYGLHRPAHVQLIVYDMLGREVHRTVASPKPPGRYSHQWNAINPQGQRLASGVYFLTVEANDHENVLQRESRTITILR